MTHGFRPNTFSFRRKQILLPHTLRHSETSEQTHYTLDSTETQKLTEVTHVVVTNVLTCYLFFIQGFCLQKETRNKLQIAVTSHNVACYCSLNPLALELDI